MRVKLRDGRLYVCGRRLHHGLSGLLLTAFGIALVIHDLKDAPWWPIPEWNDR